MLTRTTGQLSRLLADSYFRSFALELREYESAKAPKLNPALRLVERTARALALLRSNRASAVSAERDNYNYSNSVQLSVIVDRPRFI